MNNLTKINLIRPFLPKYRVFYNFYFISLITPYLTTNLRLITQFSFNEKKALMKQSYILLTWFYYLSFLETPRDLKNKLKIFILPTSRKIFTLTKAPMAHKNWSKEQYKFQFYKFKISFTSFLKNEHTLPSVNSGIFFILLSKKFFPHLETNLFFLKSYKILFFIYDFNYFNYSKFINTIIK